MISNNLLAKRLNAYKEGSPSKDPSFAQDQIFSFFNTIWAAIWFIAKIFIYGYATRLLFDTGWNFWNTILIGSTILITLTYVYNLIHDRPEHDPNNSHS